MFKKTDFLFLSFFLLLLFLPLFFMIAEGFPEIPTVIQNRGWMEALERSATIAFLAGLASTLMGAMAALFLQNNRSLLLESLSAFALVVPELVFALILLTWFSYLSIPLSLWTVFAAHVSFSMTFSLLVVSSALSQIDPRLMEAAEDLGASRFQSLIRIQLPLLRPALGASFFISFLLSFDDFVISFYVNGAGTDTLPIQLFSAIKVGLSSEVSGLATILAMVSGSATFLVLRSQGVQSLLKRSSPSLISEEKRVKWK